MIDVKYRNKAECTGKLSQGGACLVSANLENADLRRANLEKANLGGLTLREPSLRQLLSTACLVQKKR
jgi:uncharacterized protein YjbI with pentapeptide repeats